MANAQRLRGSPVNPYKGFTKQATIVWHTIGTPTEGNTMDNIIPAPAGYDPAEDSADPDVLRKAVLKYKNEAHTMRHELNSAIRTLSTAVEMLVDLRDNGHEDDIRELCDGDEEYAAFVKEHEIIDLSCEWEVRVRYGGCISITLLIEADTEQEARENAEYECNSSNLQIDVTGQCVNDWDIYDDDVEIISVSKA